MQIISLGDNLHETSKPILFHAKLSPNLHQISKPIFWGEKKNTSKMSTEIFAKNAKRLI